MSLKVTLTLSSVAGALLLVSALNAAWAQDNTESVKALRCVFSRNATGKWPRDGSADSVVKDSNLILRFDAINVDEGSAQLKSGTVATGITAQSNGGNLHLIQAFKSGALYITTVFVKESGKGKLKAVHSRHEYFKVPLEGATSSPEQYYGECEVDTQGSNDRK